MRLIINGLDHDMPDADLLRVLRDLRKQSEHALASIPRRRWRASEKAMATVAFREEIKALTMAEALVERSAKLYASPPAVTA